MIPILIRLFEADHCLVHCSSPVRGGDLSTVPGHHVEKSHQDTKNYFAAEL